MSLKPDQVIQILKSKLPRALKPPLERTPQRDGHRARTKTATIAAPPTKVFALLVDPRRQVELDVTGTVTGIVEPVPTRLASGVQFSLLVRRLGPSRAHYTVVEFEEGRRIAWAPATGQRWRFELTPGPEEETVVTATFDWSTAASSGIVERLGEPDRYEAALGGALMRLEALATGRKLPADDEGASSH